MKFSLAREVSCGEVVRSGLAFLTVPPYMDNKLKFLENRPYMGGVLTFFDLTTNLTTTSPQPHHMTTNLTTFEPCGEVCGEVKVPPPVGGEGRSACISPIYGGGLYEPHHLTTKMRIYWSLRVFYTHFP